MAGRKNDNEVLRRKDMESQGRFVYGSVVNKLVFNIHAEKGV